MTDLFTPEEEAFLANATDWLATHANPDILLNELSRRIAGPDGDGDELEAELMRAPPDDLEDWDGSFDQDEEEAPASDDDNWGDDAASETAPHPDADDTPGPG